MKTFILLIVFLGLCPMSTVYPASLPDDTRFDILYITNESSESSQYENESATFDKVNASGQSRSLLYQRIQKFVPATEAAYIADHIMQSSIKHNVDPLLAAALFEQESAYQRHAYSIAGARGIAQLMPMTAVALGVDIDDTAANIDGGIMYLGNLLHDFSGEGNMQYTLAVAAYNAGRNAVATYKGVPPYAETQNHVSAVARNYQRLLEFQN